MAYQSLYRRYRPRRFAEVRGQEQVTGALTNAVRDDRVGHAYLFSGPRGTGKTSTARILAKALNCTDLRDGEPCCECESCLSIEAGTSYDLQELDAASNNKVENVRDLIERVALGSPGRTKVYILDEVHMLSTGASNALLKTLEEPPPHVVFVLATTDPHKVLPTIRSRTQHFPFHLLAADVLTEHVRGVVADAGLDVSPEAIDQVIRQGGGSARDTLSALDQAAAAGGVTESTEHAEALVDAICANDTALALRTVADAVGNGRDPRLLGEDLLARLRDTFLTRMGASLPQATETERAQAAVWAEQLTDRLTTRALEEVGSALLEMRQAPDPRIPLEVALVRLSRPAEGGANDLGPLLERIERLEQAIARGEGAGIASATAPTAATAAPTLSQKPSAPGTAAEPSAPSPSGGRTRPGDAARAALARSAPSKGNTERSTPPTPAPPPPPPPARLRAVPDVDDSAGAAGPGQADDPETAEPNATVEVTPDDPAPEAPPTSEASPPPTVQVTALSEPVPEAEAADGNDLRNKFEAAWTGAVLPTLTGMAGALFRPAELGEFDGTTATLSFENEATRGNAERKRAEVEEVASEKYGQPIKIVLTVRGGEGKAPATAAAEVEHELIDVHDLEDAPADNRTGVDRLTEAFPGAELVQED